MVSGERREMIISTPAPARSANRSIMLYGVSAVTIQTIWRRQDRCAGGALIREQHNAVSREPSEDEKCAEHCDETQRGESCR